MLMLVVFAANFLVFCHCAARAAAAGGRHCCCEKKESHGAKHSDCQGMQAVRFNLVEKQVASSVGVVEPPMMVVTFDYVVPQVVAVEKGYRRSDWWVYKYGPPDLQVLYSRFLI